MQGLYTDRHGNIPRYEGDSPIVVALRELRNACVRITAMQEVRDKLAFQVLKDVQPGGKFDAVDSSVRLEIAEYCDEAMKKKDIDTRFEFETDPYPGRKPTTLFGLMQYVTSVIDDAIFNEGSMP